MFWIKVGLIIGLLVHGHVQSTSFDWYFQCGMHVLRVVLVSKFKKLANKNAMYCLNGKVSRERMLFWGHCTVLRGDMNSTTTITSSSSPKVHERGL